MGAFFSVTKQERLCKMTEKRNQNERIRYTRQSIVTNTFLQMPRFLVAGEFAGGGISNNARFLYTLLLDRHRISVKNGWFDENGEVYIYFKREEMEAQLGISERTVSKVMQELKDLALVEEKKQGLNKPNKIYLLIPVIDDGETASVFLCGGGDRGWKAEYDWLITSANMLKVLEGKYDNDQSNIPMPQMRHEGAYPSTQNIQERYDPFLERAMTAYETAARTA